MAHDAMPYAWDRVMTSVSSLIARGNGLLYAVSLGRGVYRVSQENGWERAHEGLPEEVTVNRLQLCGRQLYACTSKGLFEYDGERWQPHALAVPCYQLKSSGGRRIAATQYGLWSEYGTAWTPLSHADSVVYDYLPLPQFMIVGHDRGISLYDRYVGTWADFKLRAGVTSLAVYRGRIVGATDKGQLVVGNRQGGFDAYTLEGLFVYRIIQKPGNVYACTDNGLYRLAGIGGNVQLFAFQLDCPVTDVDEEGGRLYVATLFNGVQTITK